MYGSMPLQISERDHAPAVLNSHEKMDMKNVENEDKTIIYNLLHTLSKDGNTVVFSYKIFPKLIFLTLSKINQLEFAMLEKMYMVSERIDNIVMNFRKKSVLVVIKKTNDNKIKIRKRDTCNKRMAEASANHFVYKNNIRKEDKRVFAAIVKHFFAWTWKTVACRIELEKQGDDYDVTVKSLINIDFRKLRLLDQMGPWIHNMQVDLDSSVLSFKVSRTETINDLQQPSKKTKYI